MHTRTPRHRRRSLRVAAAIATFGVAVTIVAACQLPGATFVVTTTLDQPDAVPGNGICATAGGQCSLRAAITEANAGPGLANIQLTDGATYELSIVGIDENDNATGDLDVRQSLAINGHATIDADAIDRVLDVREDVLILDGPTITGGQPTDSPFPAAERWGGGIRVAQGGQLIAANTTIEDNFAWRGGGGIDSRGPVTLLRSTVRGNSIGGGYLDPQNPPTNAYGAGVAVHGSSLSATESSFADDAGAYEAFVDGAGTLALTRSTVTGSVIAPSVDIRTSTLDTLGAGDTVSGASVTVTGSTVATTNGAAVRSTVSTNAAGSIFRSTLGPACRGVVVSGGHNIASDATCSLTGPGDLPSTEPLLEPLDDNGGLTATRLPYANSPAVDAIPPGTAGLCDASSATDQRGITRPAGGGCDIGAVEGSSTSSTTPRSLVVNNAGAAADAAPGDGTCATAAAVCTLPAAIAEANAYPTADTVTISAGINPALLQQQLEVTDDLVVDGNGAVITAASGLPIFNTNTDQVTITDLTLDATSGLAIKVSSGHLIAAELEVATGYISVEPNADLDLDRSTVRGALAIYGHAVVTRSTLVAQFSSAVDLLWPNTDPASGLVLRASTVVGGTNPGSAAVFKHLGAVPAQISGSVLVSATGPACTKDPTDPATVLVVSQGYNAISDSSCGAAATGDLIGASPLVLPLAENGGPTATALLAPTSPAVNAIPNATAGLCDATFTTDQRGLPRPVGGACDIGATERQ